MPDDAKKFSRLPNPSRMLLADECPEYHDELLSEYYEDLKPVGVLERRQVELILRCDIDIDRQLRIIEHHLNPLQEVENRGAEMVAEWHRQALCIQMQLMFLTLRRLPLLRPSTCQSETRA